MNLIGLPVSLAWKGYGSSIFLELGNLLPLEISPVTGNYNLCKWYIRIDGEYSLLDYGVCTNSKSGLDSKVVNCSSGCPAFVQEET